MIKLKNFAFSYAKKNLMLLYNISKAKYTNVRAKILKIISTIFGFERIFLKREKIKATNAVEISHPISTSIKNK